MLTTDGGEHWLQVFLQGFAARDLAEPLASFDDTAAFTDVRKGMDQGRLEVVGIRRDGVLTGWISRSDANGADAMPLPRPFEREAVVRDDASLQAIIAGLHVYSHLFVRSCGQIAGVVCREDVQKPPMRMWLFGLVTISELRVTEWIESLCPDDSWRRYLSEGRLHKAEELQKERRRRGQTPTLLDCLQLADKGRIVGRDARLRELTRFDSQRKVEEFVQAFQDLRNNLAHAQDISGDWQAIYDLACNLHRIVLGPPDAVSSENKLF
jgi:hypothetical protein